MKHSSRVLVVEDDLQIRQMMYLILTKAGYETDAVEDGQAGWEALQKNHYQLVITDSSMPRLRGAQLIQKMRTAGMSVPVIVASAFLSPGDEDDFHGVSVDGRLVKPFRIDEMLGLVKSVLTKNLRAEEFAKAWRTTTPTVNRIQ